jgi:hypothetical protein
MKINEYNYIETNFYIYLEHKNCLNFFLIRAERIKEPSLHLIGGTEENHGSDRTSEHSVTDQIKEKDLGKTYSMHTDNEKCIENLKLGIGTDHLGFISVDGKMSNRV